MNSPRACHGVEFAEHLVHSAGNGEWGFGFRVSGFGLRVQDLGFGVSGFGFRFEGL